MARAPVRSGRSQGSASGPGSGFVVLGNRVPAIVFVLAIATFAASIIGAVGERNGFPLMSWAALNPDLILHGQLWRLFTWVFFEASPFGLLFGCLMLVTIGSDLASRWSPTRFVLYYLGLTSLVAGVICGMSYLLPSLRDMVFVGTWPAQEALIILWAAYYPSRQIRFFFLLPVAGRSLIYATIGFTVLMALYYGIALFIPHFVAETIALAIAFAPTPRNLWLEAKLRGIEKQRRATHLKSVPRNLGDDEDPPSGGRWLN